MQREVANKQIRNRIAKSKLKCWEVASTLGINSSTFSVWLRQEMDPEHKRLVNDAIDRLIKK